MTLTNAESIKKAKQPYRNALIYAAKFSNGVPEAELDAYSKAVKINITIKTYGDKVIYESPKLSNSIGTLNFFNSRMNHVEVLRYDICNLIQMMADHVYRLRGYRMH